MDIDEFLDREYSEIGLITDKTKKFETETEFPGLKEDFENTKLFENIKISLSRGDLDKAEQNYIQLWELLSLQKLKWNKELYMQLLTLNKEFLNTLNKSYFDTKRKIENIKQLISQAREYLRAGKKDISFKLYSQIEGIDTSIPNAFFEEKILLREQILEFYRELRIATDIELVKRVSILIQQLNGLLVKINDSIKANDMANAITNYVKSIEIYNQVPEGFLRYKGPLGLNLVEFYKSLSIYAEISNLQRQLNHNSQFQQKSAVVEKPEQRNK